MRRNLNTYHAAGMSRRHVKKCHKSSKMSKFLNLVTIFGITMRNISTNMPGIGYDLPAIFDNLLSHDRPSKGGHVTGDTYSQRCWSHRDDDASYVCTAQPTLKRYIFHCYAWYWFRNLWNFENLCVQSIKMQTLEMISLYVSSYCHSVSHNLYCDCKHIIYFMSTEDSIFIQAFSSM